MIEFLAWMLTGAVVGVFLLALMHAAPQEKDGENDEN